MCLAIICLGPLGLLACDRTEVETRSVSETSNSIEAGKPEDGPLLASAPWFELPEDWARQHPVLSPNAKTEAHWLALAEREIPKNPADGGGRAWIESVEPVGPSPPDDGWRTDESSSDHPTVVASSFHRFEINFEVGPRGIEEGGMIFLNPEAFWYWSESQNRDPRIPGYTTARLRESQQGSAEVELIADALTGGFRVSGRRLESGERIDFIYGAGPAGAQVDRYADRASEIHFAVDADGDGYRRWLAEGARLDVSAQTGARMLAHGPAEIAPGAGFEVVIAWTDRRGNRASWPAATLDSSGRSVANFDVYSLDSLATPLDSLATPLDSLATPLDGSASRLAGSVLSLEGATTSLTSSSDPRSPHRLPLTPVPGEGTLRLRIEGRGALAGHRVDLPPIIVRESETRLVWGDLHGHSALSDGTGTPQDYFAYARDVARLDVVALTDHDHWGPRPLDERPEVAAGLLATAQDFNAPGRFVTIPGYEWTNWLHGHRHVLYFDGKAPIFSSLDSHTDRPDELWAALRGRAALTFAHHSAGEPVATNWLYAPDPELEPLTEIVSVHGTSEASDAPGTVRGALPGYFVRDTLLHGYRLGFIGSGDSHDGHPGLAQIASGQAGLAGIFTSSLDRPGLLEAMRSRRTFATNGIRSWLEVRIDGVFMGGTLPLATDIAPGIAPGIAPDTAGGLPARAAPDEKGSQNDRDPTDGSMTGIQPDGDGHLLEVRYEGTAPIERVDLIRSGRKASLTPATTLSYTLERSIPRLEAGEFHYVRIQQTDGGISWSSPIFASPSASTRADESP